MRYLLDADVFIEADKRYYNSEFFPGFWDWVLDQHYKRLIYSIERVKKEIDSHEGETSLPLRKWASGMPKSFFLAPDELVVKVLPTLSNWSQSSTHYFERAKAEFLNSADYHLIAMALAHGDIVVTHEMSQPNVRKKIKIPDACEAHGVTCISTFEMFKAEKVRFVVDRPVIDIESDK